MPMEIASREGRRLERLRRYCTTPGNVRFCRGLNLRAHSELIPLPEYTRAIPDPTPDKPELIPLGRWEDLSSGGPDPGRPRP